MEAVDFLGQIGAVGSPATAIVKAERPPKGFPVRSSPALNWSMIFTRPIESTS